MYLDHANPDSIAKNILLTRDTLHSLLREARQAPDGLDVRLVANEDGELWFATGDVQYDTAHGFACESCTLVGTEDEDDLRSTAHDLVLNVADRLATEGE